MSNNKIYQEVYESQTKVGDDNAWERSKTKNNRN
jgi:hypothetical protein